MLGRGFVDYSENREHTHRYKHKGPYRVHHRLTVSYAYENKSNCPSFCLSDNVNHPYDHQFHRHINDLEFVEPRPLFLTLSICYYLGSAMINLQSLFDYYWVQLGLEINFPVSVAG